MRIGFGEKLFIFAIFLTVVYFIWFSFQKKGRAISVISIQVVSPSVTPTLTLALTPTPTLTPTITPVPTINFVSHEQKYGPCRTVPVLMYHHVLPTEAAKAIQATNLNVPPEIFREQINYLIGKGYTVIGLDEMLPMIRDNSLPGKPVVLTFDDAYRNFYDNVYPVLKEKTIKATVFVITQFVGGERYVTWEQLQEMAGSGLVEIGNHTLNHLYLSKLSEEEVRNQIVSAKNILEAQIGRPVDFFAYPYGNSSRFVKAVLQEAGVKGALLTTHTSPQCLGLPYDLSRIRIGAAPLARFGL